ncbi:MAG: apolipoprotein N-acyltransferase [Actinomycetota bacterium]
MTDERRQTRLARLALALGAGALVALSMPPWGWWPLSFVGIAAFGIAQSTVPVCDGVSGRRGRAATGYAFGAGWMFLGMGWMVQLTAPGYLVAGAVFAAYHAVAASIAPSGRWAIVGRPAAHTLVEALRFSFPFGGVPLASLGIAQVAGPFAGIGRVGGTVLVTWFTFQIGFALGALVTAGPGHRASASHRRPMLRIPDRIVLAAVGSAVGVLVLALVVAPRGTATGDTLRVAAVQGGGRQGTSAAEVPWPEVFIAHLEATRELTIDDDIDLVVWPENTLDVDSFTESPAPLIIVEAAGGTGATLPAILAAEAARLDAPIAVGITEELNDGQNRTNAQVVVAPDGTIVSRYDKVRRVPFGEYVPLRGVLEFFGAPIERIGRDALPGTDPALLELPDGTELAVAISWEIFFGGRAREGVELGGEAIINPTNGASYTGTIVQTQQVASSRQRAIENGRWVVQAAPTGFTAIIDEGGQVLARTSISERAILIDDIELRTELTWYARLGDAPWIVMAAAALLSALAVARRASSKRYSDLHDQGDGAVVDEFDAHVGAESTAGD